MSDLFGNPEDRFSHDEAQYNNWFQLGTSTEELEQAPRSFPFTIQVQSSKPLR